MQEQIIFQRARVVRTPARTHQMNRHTPVVNSDPDLLNTVAAGGVLGYHQSILSYAPTNGLLNIPGWGLGYLTLELSVIVRRQMPYNQGVSQVLLDVTLSSLQGYDIVRLPDGTYDIPPECEFIVVQVREKPISAQGLMGTPYTLATVASYDDSPEVAITPGTIASAAMINSIGDPEFTASAPLTGLVSKNGVTMETDATVLSSTSNSLVNAVRQSKSPGANPGPLGVLSASAPRRSAWAGVRESLGFHFLNGSLINWYELCTHIPGLREGFELAATENVICATAAWGDHSIENEMSKNAASMLSRIAINYGLARLAFVMYPTTDHMGGTTTAIVYPAGQGAVLATGERPPDRSQLEESIQVSVGRYLLDSCPWGFCLTVDWVAAAPSYIGLNAMGSELPTMLRDIPNEMSPFTTGITVDPNGLMNIIAPLQALME